MPKSSTSVPVRKRYFIFVSLIAMLTCLLYLYTTDYKIVEPLVKSPGDKILNLFREITVGDISNENEVEVKGKEIRHSKNGKSDVVVSNALFCDNNSCFVSNISKSEISHELVIQQPRNENPKPVSKILSFGTNSTLIHTDILKQNLSTDVSTPVPGTTMGQKVNHTDILTQNSASYTFDFSKGTLTNSLQHNPTPTSSNPANESFIHSGFHSRQSPSNKVVDCDQLWVTSHENGRLGNIMCEYAHLMILHLEYGVQVGLLPTMHNSLSPFFPNLSMKRLPWKCLQVKNIANYDWNKLDSLLRDQKLKKPSAAGGYPCNPKRLWKYRDLWRKEFNFSTSIKQKANSSLVQSLKLYKLRLLENKQRLQKINNTSRMRNENTQTSKQHVSSNTTIGKIKVIKPINVPNTANLPKVKNDTLLKEKTAFTDQNSIPDPLVIGVHVRRTDYISYFKRTTGDSIVGYQYFQKAFQYFRKKYNNVLFLVSSDDRQWCHKALERPNMDVIVAPAGSPQQDMALLATSSHLIMSLGTYGFWSAILSRGTVAYPKKVGKMKEYFLTKSLNTFNLTELVPIDQR